MLTAMKAIASMRADGLKPSVVEVYLTGKKQFAFWSQSDRIAEVSLPIAPEVVRTDFRPLVGCKVMLFAETRSELLRKVVRRLIEVVSALTVFVFDEVPASVGYEWQQGKGWREVAGGVR